MLLSPLDCIAGKSPKEWLGAVRQMITRGGFEPVALDRPVTLSMKERHYPRGEQPWRNVPLMGGERFLLQDMELNHDPVRDVVRIDVRLAPTEASLVGQYRFAQLPLDLAFDLFPGLLQQFEERVFGEPIPRQTSNNQVVAAHSPTPRFDCDTWGTW